METDNITELKLYIDKLEKEKKSLLDRINDICCGLDPEGRIYDQDLTLEQCKKRNKRQRSRARHFGVECSLNHVDYKLLRDKQKGKCYYCNRATHLTLDHIIPICKGGGHTKENVVFACPECNTQKGEKDLEEFILEKNKSYAEVLKNHFCAG